MPTWLDEASELLTWLTIASIVVGALAFIAKKYMNWLRDLIKEEIATHTSLIQPTSNGGKSLPDIAAKVDRILVRLEMENK